MTTVLIIEDDQVLRENTKELLEVNGYLVHAAPDGKKGVELALSRAPDIILCDIIMPELDGYQVLEILTRKKLTQNTPFLFLTAKTELADIRRGMNLGADDYITKPFEEEDLLLAIESRLAKLQLHKARNGQGSTGINPSTLGSLEQLKSLIREKGSLVEFSCKEILYAEGEKARYTYLLQEGLVKIYKVDDWGKEIIIDIMKEGDFVGISLFSSSLCAEAATALQKGSAYRIFNTRLKEILVENPSVLLELTSQLSQDLSDLQDHLLGAAYSGVLKKTAQAIFHYAIKMKKAPGDLITVSRGDLAKIAGISTESFIRSLALLKEEKLVEIEGRNIKILDLRRLEHVQ